MQFVVFNHGCSHALIYESVILDVGGRNSFWVFCDIIRGESMILFLLLDIELWCESNSQNRLFQSGVNPFEPKRFWLSSVSFQVKEVIRWDGMGWDGKEEKRREGKGRGEVGSIYTYRKPLK